LIVKKTYYAAGQADSHGKEKRVINIALSLTFSTLERKKIKTSEQTARPGNHGWLKKDVQKELGLGRGSGYVAKAQKKYHFPPFVGTRP